MIANVLFSLAFFLVLILFFTKNRLHLILYFSVFSAIVAAAYFVMKAPDLALAEVAVGCAFIPLIFLITVGKHRVFTVLILPQRHVGISTSESMLENVKLILKEFCNDYELDLKILDTPKEEMGFLYQVFRPGNVDLICSYDTEKNIVSVQGNQSNVIINVLQKHFDERKDISWKWVGIDEEYC